MRNKNIIYYLIFASALILVYAACFSAAYRGYGYPGYRGYHHHHHSSWYFGRHDSAYGSSVRENSVNGSRFSRKGINGGK